MFKGAALGFCEGWHSARGVAAVREGSPLLGHVQPGERVVAFTREDGSMIECTGMSDAALAHAHTASPSVR